MENVSDKFDDSISMENVVNSVLDVIQPNRVIQGEIVTIDADFAYVNVGTKSDGRVSLNEFETRPNVGDVIDIMLVDKRMIDGMYIFSSSAARTEKSWRAFLESYRTGNEYVSGKISGAAGKGLIIDCDGVSAFLPFSQTGDLRGKKGEPGDTVYTFKIKNVDDKKRNALLSRREYCDELKEKVWENLASNYKPGDRIKGRVTRLVEYGAFVDLGGVEGLLHKTDITWKRVFKTKNILKPDEEREFVVLDIKREEGRISLGLKQLEEDPWALIDSRYNVGDSVAGKVVTLTNQGAFIEIEDGVEGYLGSSDVSWTRRNVAVKDILGKGDSAQVMILGINREDRRLSLGLKQLTENPWDTIHERFPVGSVHKCPVKNIVSFGMFVALEEDIDGLVHVSDVSWDDTKKDLSSIYRAGDMVEFKILEIKKEEMRIACGIKQLTPSPWEILREKYPPRSRVSGAISSIVPFGLFVRLEDDVEGLVHISEVSRKKIENLNENFKVGDQVNAIVQGVDVDRKRISLSMKHYEAAIEKEELNRILKNASSNRVTIGDLIKMKQGE